MTDLNTVGFKGDTSGLKSIDDAIDTTKAKVQDLNEELSKTNRAGVEASAGLDRTKLSAQSLASQQPPKIIPDDVIKKINDTISSTEKLGKTLTSVVSDSSNLRSISSNMEDVGKKTDATSSSVRKLTDGLLPLSASGSATAALGNWSFGIQDIGAKSETSSGSVRRFADSFSGVGTAALGGANLRAAASDITEIGTRSEGAGSSVKKLSEGFVGLGSAAAGGSFRGLTSNLKEIETGAAETTGGLKKITDAVENVAEKFVVVGAATAQFMGGVKDAGSEAGSTAEKIGKVGEATEGVKSIWESFVGGFKDGFKEATQGAKEFSAAGSDVDRIIRSIQSRNLSMTTEEIAARLNSAKVAFSEEGIAAAAAAEKTAATAAAAEAAAAAAANVATAHRGAAAAASASKVEHAALGVTMQEVRGVASALAAPLQQAGIHIGNIGSISGAARLGILGLGLAISGGLAVYLTKLDEDAVKSKARLEGLAGVKMGEQYAAEVKQLDKELGTVPASVQPAYEALIKLSQLNGSGLSGSGVRIFSGMKESFDQSSLSADKMRESVEAVFQQFKLGEASTEEATKGTNQFFQGLQKNGALTGDMLRRLEDQSPRLASAITNAFKGGSMSAEEFARELDKAPLSLNSLLQMLPHLYQASKDAFDGMKEHPKTLSGAIERTTEAFKGLWTEMNNGQTPSETVIGAINSVGTALKDATKGLEEYKKGLPKQDDASFWNSLGRTIGSEMDSISQKIKDTKKEIDEIKNAWAVFNRVMDGGVGGLDQNSSDIEKLGLVAGVVGREIGKISGQMGTDLDNFKRGLSEAGTAADSNTGTFQNLGRVVGQVGKDFDDFTTGVINSKQPLSDDAGLFESLGHSVGIASSAIASFAQSIGSGILSGLEIIGNAVADSIAKLTEWANAAIAKAKTVASAIASAASNQNASPMQIDDPGGGASLFGNSISGTSSSGGGTDYAQSVADGSYPAFATGGSFLVGGSGGTDSQLIQFMASPGERVTVEPPATGGDAKTLGSLLPADGVAGSEAGTDVLAAHFASDLKDQTAAISDKLGIVKDAIAEAVNNSGSAITAAMKALTVASIATTPGAKAAAAASAPSSSTSSSALGGTSASLSSGGGGGGGISGFRNEKSGSTPPEAPSKPMTQEQADAAGYGDGLVTRGQGSAIKGSQGGSKVTDANNKPSSLAQDRTFSKSLDDRGMPSKGGSPVTDANNKPSSLAQDRTFSKSMDDRGMPSNAPDMTPVRSFGGRGGVTSSMVPKDSGIDSAGTEKITDAVQKNTDATKSIGDKQDASLDKVSDAADKSAVSVGDQSEKLSDISEVTKSSGEEVKGSLDTTNEKIGTLSETTSSSGEAVKGSLDQVSQTVSQVPETIQSSGESISNAVSEGASNVSSAVQSGSAEVSSAVQSAASSISSAVSSAVSSAASSASNTSDSAGAGGTSSGNSPAAIDYGGGSSSDGYFAAGGQFTVSGQGGTDSEFVKFWATPGEIVTVTPPGGKAPPHPSMMSEGQQQDHFASGGQFGVSGQGGTDTEPVEFWATPGEVVTITPPGGTPPPNPSSSPPQTKSDSRAFATGGQITLGAMFDTPMVSKTSADVINAHFSSSLHDQSESLGSKIDDMGSRIVEASDNSASRIMSAIGSVSSAIPEPMAPAEPTATATATSSSGGAGASSGSGLFSLDAQRESAVAKYQAATNNMTLGRNDLYNSRSFNAGPARDGFGRLIPGYYVNGDGETVPILGVGSFPAYGFAKGGQFRVERGGRPAFATGGQIRVGASRPAFATGGQITVDDSSGMNLASTGADIVSSAIDRKTDSQTAAIKGKIDSTTSKVVSAINGSGNRIASGVSAIRDRFDAWKASVSISAKTAPSSSISGSDVAVPASPVVSSPSYGVGAGNRLGGLGTALLDGTIQIKNGVDRAGAAAAARMGGMNPSFINPQTGIGISPFAGMADGGTFVVPGGQSGTDSVDVSIHAAPGERIMVLPPEEAARLKKLKSNIHVAPEPLSSYIPALRGGEAAVPGGQAPSMGSAPLPFIPGGAAPMVPARPAQAAAAEPVGDPYQDKKNREERTVKIFVQAGVQADTFIKSRAEIQRVMR
jgi:hypothetical protein